MVNWVGLSFILNVNIGILNCDDIGPEYRDEVVVPAMIDEDTAEQIREGKIIRDGSEDVWDVENGIHLSICGKQKEGEEEEKKGILQRQALPSAPQHHNSGLRKDGTASALICTATTRFVY